MRRKRYRNPWETIGGIYWLVEKTKYKDEWTWWGFGPPRWCAVVVADLLVKAGYLEPLDSCFQYRWTKIKRPITVEMVVEVIERASTSAQKKA